MQDEQVVAQLRDKYVIIFPELDERGRRRWAAMEAHSLGWGGVTAVALATGLSDRTIRNGIREICGLDELGDRQRRPGAGRKRRESEQPGIPKALDTLVEPDTRGDPMSPLRWTCKSTYKLAEALQAKGHQVSQKAVYSLLQEMGYSNVRNLEGGYTSWCEKEGA